MDSHRKPEIWKPLHIVKENALSVSLARKISIHFWDSSKKSSQVTWEDTSHKQQQNLRKSKKKQRHRCVTFSFCIFWAWTTLQRVSYNLFVSIQTWRGHQTWSRHYWRTTYLKTFWVLQCNLDLWYTSYVFLQLKIEFAVPIQSLAVTWVKVGTTNKNNFILSGSSRVVQITFSCNSHWTLSYRCYCF